MVGLVENHRKTKQAGNRSEKCPKYHGQADFENGSSRTVCHGLAVLDMLYASFWHALMTMLFGSRKNEGYGTFLDKYLSVTLY
ncbi:hypothetical protein TNCV_1601161 [Trichonephila clavipes]|nr:hypothetical protein TNCV_1601161 [Trichonephila clavipes]